MLCHEIACASGDRIHRDPAHLKSKRLQARDEYVLDCDHSSQMHGAAVDVDQLLEQRAVSRAVGIDGRGHPGLERSKPGGAGLALGERHRSCAYGEKNRGFQELHAFRNFMMCACESSIRDPPTIAVRIAARAASNCLAPSIQWL